MTTYTCPNGCEGASILDCFPAKCGKCMADLLVDGHEQEIKLANGARLRFGPTPERFRGNDEPDDEPECNCAKNNCTLQPCKGSCGCRACHNAYQDFLSFE